MDHLSHPLTDPPFFSGVRAGGHDANGPLGFAFKDLPNALHLFIKSMPLGGG